MLCALQGPCQFDSDATRSLHQRRTVLVAFMAFHNLYAIFVLHHLSLSSHVRLFTSFSGGERGRDKCKYIAAPTADKTVRRREERRKILTKQSPSAESEKETKGDGVIIE